ncbi:hypothetical protein CFP65_7534 [Kitasatospora sp. MMS16-BH015]|uniref:bestrophin-like domain n=1 Tax=Kitasatospora sp. MMS16-BH015 TaxID=2018025 RepID=UPI000CA1FCD3|nr:DUF4239 domain-containing protein [Kitasatospora sp. MMS16-BH015]AUG82108.1 hypothetical protein CFP65_7534 [Kitasatospora sp. MMS16-BH015]
MLLHFLEVLFPVLFGTLAVLWAGSRIGLPWIAPNEQRQTFDHVTTLLRMVFAFTLAFVVVAVWQEYGEGARTANAEAAALTEVNWSALQLPTDQRDGVRQRLLAYTHKVIDQEWPVMLDRRTIDPGTRDTWDDLRRYAAQLPRNDDRTASFQQRMLTQLEKAGDARRARGDEAQAGLPPVLWIGLVTGAALMLLLPAVWSTAFTARSTVLVLLLATMLTGLLFAVSEMDHAFSGDIRVPPTAFHTLLERLERLS